MKALNWARYSWDLAKTASSLPALPPSYAIRYATLEESSAVRAVILSAFTLDCDWNPFFREIHPLAETALAEVFDEKKEPFCLILTHGSRIIGASGLTAEREAKSHLLTGPCLSMEYHNRGLGSILLAHSLAALREAGLSTARGMTKEGSITAQFIYSKFGSVRV